MMLLQHDIATYYCDLIIETRLYLSRIMFNMHLAHV
jgi:hypothetical protein